MTFEPTSSQPLADTAADVDWNGVYASHLPRIYNYFRFRLGSNVDVQELTARTFEKAWRERRRYRRDLAGFSTWLFTIAHNVGVDYLRTRRKHVPIDTAGDLAAEGTPEASAAHASDLARLQELTARMPERTRELIALKYGAGANNRLIAKLTGLSESNVGTILHRAVESLRAEW